MRQGKEEIKNGKQVGQAGPSVDKSQAAFEATANQFFAIGGQANTKDSRVEKLEIKVGKLIKYLSNSVSDILYSIGSPDAETLTEDILYNYFEWLVDARVAYVSGVRCELHPKEVVVPTIVYTLLAQIGNYRDELGSIQILPTLRGTAKVDKKSNKLLAPEGYDDLVRAMRRSGLELGEGLPMRKQVDSPLMYQLSVATDGAITGPKGLQLDPFHAAARAAYDFAALSSIFGAHSVSYAVTNALEAFSYAYAKQFIRNPRGLAI